MHHLVAIVWACTWMLYGLLCCHWLFRKSRIVRARIWVFLLWWLWAYAVASNFYLFVRNFHD